MWLNSEVGLTYVSFLASKDAKTARLQLCPECILSLSVSHIVLIRTEVDKTGNVQGKFSIRSPLIGGVELDASSRVIIKG